MELRKIEQSLAVDFSGPIIFDYVWWVLTQAQNRKITTLYFLARDGYVLREIAQKICEKFRLPIECRYFYCSRASLRMPSYHLIGDEAIDLLLLGGYNVTLNSLMQRAELSDEQCLKVYEECQISNIDRDAVLNARDFKQVCSLLRQSQLFRQFVMEKSKSKYADTIGYLRQEGMLDRSVVAIVDSGWTGSMQRSLRQLLQSAGYQGELIGFYYGMYASPKSVDDGTYLTWMFHSHKGTTTKVLFCNNLFECLLSAPHGMTVGYIHESRTYRPCLLPETGQEHSDLVQRQIAALLQYAEYRLGSLHFEEFHASKLRHDALRRFWRYMVHPTRDEATVYGQFLFCDDVTEGYHLHLADESQIEALKGYSMVARIGRKLLRRPVTDNRIELFWPYGTIALLSGWRKCWYRWNIYMWELAKYVLQRK